MDWTELARHCPQFGSSLTNVTRRQDVVFADRRLSGEAQHWESLESEPFRDWEVAGAVRGGRASQSHVPDWRDMRRTTVECMGVGGEQGLEEDGCCGGGQDWGSESCARPSRRETGAKQVDELPWSAGQQLRKSRTLLYTVPRHIPLLSGVPFYEMFPPRQDHLVLIEVVAPGGVCNVRVEYREDGKCKWGLGLDLETCDLEMQCRPSLCFGIFNFEGNPFEEICEEEGQIVHGTLVHITGVVPVVIPDEIIWYCLCGMRRRARPHPVHSAVRVPEERPPLTPDALVAYIERFGRLPRGMSVWTAQRIMGPRWSSLGRHIPHIVRQPQRARAAR